MSYTTQPLVESYLGRKLTADEARLSFVLFQAVDDWINGYTGRNYAPSGASEARYFDGGEPLLFIDSIIDIESVSYLNEDGTENTAYFAGDDYVAYPLNNASKTRLKRTSAYRWPRGSGRIKVVGKWGNVGGVPKDIQLAATILASDWLSSEDKLKSESIEGYSRTFMDTQDSNPQVHKILDSRKRVLL